MSLDLYSGSLSRYYTRNFETPQARFARENEVEYQMVYTGDTPWLNETNIQSSMDAFRASIRERVSEVDPGLADWDDQIDHFHSAQLFQECLWSLILLAAYKKRPDLDCPLHLPTDLADDPAYAEAVDKNYYFGTLGILECQLFLPSQSNAFFFCQDPMGCSVVITTTSNLAGALDMLAEDIWNGEAQPEEWFQRGSAPTTGKTLILEKKRFPWSKKFKEVQEPQTNRTLMWNAEYAFACFTDALKFSQLHKAPIRLDG